MYLIAHLLMGDLQCQNQDPIFDLQGKSVSFFDLQGFCIGNSMICSDIWYKYH